MGSKTRNLSLDIGPSRNESDSMFSLLRTPSVSSTSSLAESSFAVFSKLDKLDEQERHTSGHFYHINKTHWADSKRASNCHLCGKHFGFSSKKYNCRRCGKVFCEVCCQYRSRLSKNAVPDPNGNLYRVCSHCAELNVQAMGQTRSLTSLFLMQRKNKRVNVALELERLLAGFKANIKSSRLKSLTTETISLVKVPDWQKSPNWLASGEVEWCSNCSTKFSYLMQKHHCRICGVVVCWKCCLQDLMLYYDDGKVAQWTLIKVVGCPDSEPGVCLYLSVCHPCREEIEELQVQQFYDDSNDGKSACTVERIGQVLAVLRRLEDRITSNLPRYQELVESLMDGKKLNEIAGTGQNVVQIFAKLQLDISDVFTEYLLTIQGLKKLDLTTRSEVKIMRHVIDVKYAFYSHHTSLFKVLKENLSKTLPTDALQEVQYYSNKNAINNTCIIVKQLGHEALMLADTSKFEPSVAMILSQADSICSDDLKAILTKCKENWQDHDRQMKDLLRLQLAEHRLVSPPKSSKTRNRSDFVSSILVDRSIQVLTQTLASLEAKSSQKEFSRSKECLRSVLEQLDAIQKENKKWTIPIS